MNEVPTLLPACDSEEGSAQRQEENREYERSRRLRAYREGFLGALSGEPSVHNINEVYSDEWLDGWMAGANVLAE